MELEIFSDETYVYNNKYVGIGCLFVPTYYKLKLVNKLLSLRCLNDKNTNKWVPNQNDCNMFKQDHCKPIHHNYNNCEIHYSAFRRGMSQSLKRISTRWIEFLVNNNKFAPENEKIYFNILFLDLDKLDSKFFGEDETGNNKYNRFYKTTITGPLKYFFKEYNQITIKEIFHDESDDKMSHEYFDWHTPYILNEKRNITVKKDRITFIDSDHKEYNHNDENYINATLIQFIDLILGCTSHALFRESADKEKLKLYKIYYPLISRIWEHPKNKNSSFKYFRSQQVSIFPKDKISYYTDLFGEIHRKPGEFHRDVQLIEPEEIQNFSLDNFMF
ncbi:MAG: hypothetical protein E7Z77_00750 [Methanobrevibacter sp.]|uniref:hypothetical protein n=1 Tax=Methanobrevibacter sp. TaxID=66852 RepID=UPI0025E5FA35|nr:hypothetical protein [Methanobrevibacter sp.]MBE6507920.1 hypothetical protein [Methanobrevibacter sp.]